MTFSSSVSRYDGLHRHPSRESNFGDRQIHIANTINRFGSKIRVLGARLNTFSIFINRKLPFLDGFGFAATFKSNNKSYVSLVQQHKKLVFHYQKKTIDRYLEQRSELRDGELLCQTEDTIEQVNSELEILSNLFNHMKIHVRDNREFICKAKKESLEEVNTLDPYYDLYPGRPFYESLGPDAEDVLDEQYLVGCLMRGYREFKWMGKTLEDIYETYRSEWNLPKEDFKELVFLKRIIQPNRLKETMETLYERQEVRYDQHIALVLQLKKDLGIIFDEAIRVQKAITIYKRWQTELNGYIQHYSRNNHNRSRWAQAYNITQLLSYEKTRFMNRMFDRGQYADVVVKALETYASYVKNKSPQEKLTFLQGVRKRCLEKNRKLEDALYRIVGIQSAFDKTYMVSLLALGISEHPAYQMARLSNQMISKDLFGFGEDDIPKDLQQAGGRLSGMLVFTIEHITSSWLGGSYALISSLNRCLFAHLGSFIRYTEALDEKVEPLLSKGVAYTPESMHSGIKWLKEGVRWDEEGTRQKEAYLRWLSELFIAIGLTGGQYALPTAIAFSLARALSHGSREVFIRTLYARRFSSRLTAEKISYFIQFFSFPLFYQYGFQFGAHIFPEKKEISVSKALDVLGLSSLATDREILDAHRRLVLKYHPDKNIGANATHLKELTDNFRRVQEAYEVLQKKM